MDSSRALQDGSGYSILSRVPTKSLMFVFHKYTNRKQLKADFTQSTECLHFDKGISYIYETTREYTFEITESMIKDPRKIYESSSSSSGSTTTTTTTTISSSGIRNSNNSSSSSSSRCSSGSSSSRSSSSNSSSSRSNTNTGGGGRNIFVDSYRSSSSSSSCSSISGDGGDPWYRIGADKTQPPEFIYNAFGVENDPDAFVGEDPTDLRNKLRQFLTVGELKVTKYSTNTSLLAQ